MIDIKIKLPKDIMMIQIDKPIKQSLFEVAQNIRTDAVMNAPFKSWTLRRSLSVIVEDKWYSATVWTNLIYWPIQEYWWVIEWRNWKNLHFKIWWKWITKKRVTIPWKRYIWKAVEKNTPTIWDIFIKNIKKYLWKNLWKTK